MRRELTELLDGPLLPLEKAVPILKSFAVSLNNLHRLGELWDHSEQGIFVTDDGDVVVKGTISARNSRLKTGEIDVQRDILPPEYLTSQFHDVRSDIYGWGIISYEVITGDSPFKATSVYGTMKSRMQQSIELPDDFKIKCGNQLSNVLTTSLKQDPELRFQSAQDLILALSKVKL